MFYLIYDLAIIAILLFFFLHGKKKGLVLTVCGFLTLFVALIGASVVSNALTEPVAELVRPVVEENIQNALEEAIRHTEFVSTGGGMAETPDQLPLNAVLQQMKDSQLYQGFADAFQRAVDGGLTDATANAAQAVADFVALELTRMVLYLISFVVILAVWFFVSHALDLAAHLPLLSTVNQWLGGAVGILEGVLVLFLAAWLLRLWGYLPQEAIDQTYLLHYLCTVNPLDVVNGLG